MTDLSTQKTDTVRTFIAGVLHHPSQSPGEFGFQILLYRSVHANRTSKNAMNTRFSRVLPSATPDRQKISRPDEPSNASNFGNSSRMVLLPQQKNWQPVAQLPVERSFVYAGRFGLIIADVDNSSFVLTGQVDVGREVDVRVYEVC